MCYYGNRTFTNGNYFQALDDCNVCVCDGGKVSCTELHCGTGMEKFDQCEKWRNYVCKMFVILNHIGVL